MIHAFKYLDAFVQIVNIGYLVVLVILGHDSERFGLHPEVNVL